MRGKAIEERVGPNGPERLCALGESEECKGWTPLEEFPKTGDEKRRAACTACKNTRKRRYYSEGRFRIDVERERENERRHRLLNKDRRLRQHREYLERVKADPERHERLKEARRMAYRLKREREGVEVRPANRPPDRTMIPAEPLAALVTRVLEERRAIAEIIDEPLYGAMSVVCRDLGLNERKYRAWCYGEYKSVTISLAEDVMLRADVDPSDVYSPDDHAEVLALFAGVGLIP